jgi:hypothetical protein
MKLLDWLGRVIKKDGAPAPAPGPEQRAVDDPELPGRRRALHRDPRWLPKPPKKRYWDKRDPVLTVDEADRAFSPSLRTRHRGLRSLLADVELLSERGLPVWRNEADVADALALSVSRLRWLACHRYDDAVTHYIYFRIPKRSGGERIIAAPKRELKRVQRALLRQLVALLPVSDHAHGFVIGRSVATNARPHVGKRVVLRYDLEDFFGTVTFGRVRGFLIAMGYGYEVATAVALLCTDADRQPVEVDGEIRHVPVGHRTCVQGAPTSPSICNAIAMRLDRRLAGLAAASGFAYTRYADDLTLSGDDEGKIGMLTRAVGEIVAGEGFRLNRSKTRIMRSGGRQRVTGVVVNQVAGLSRAERRKLRAQLHQLGPDTPARERVRLEGKLAYLQMINPEQAAALRASPTKDR